MSRGFAQPNRTSGFVFGQSSNLGKEIYEKLNNTDVLFKFSNGDTLRAHLCFMELVPKLYELCETHGRHGECQVFVDKYTSTTFDLLLEYVYARPSVLSAMDESNCFECLTLADDFDLNGLKKIVERFIVANHAVHYKNYVEIIENEYYRKSDVVLEEITKFFVEYVDALDLSVIPKELFQEVLKKAKSMITYQTNQTGNNNTGNGGGFGTGNGNALGLDNTGYGGFLGGNGGGVGTGGFGTGNGGGVGTGGFGTGNDGFNTRNVGGFGSPLSQTPSGFGYPGSISNSSSGFGSSVPQTSSGFGSPGSISNSSSGFGSPAPQTSSGFGSSGSTSNSSSGFGSSAPQTTSGFGSSAPQTTSGFGSSAPQTSSGFGSTPTRIFGSTSNSRSGFDSPAPQTSSGFAPTPTFGSSAPQTTSGFGSSAPQTPSGFGSTPKKANLPSRPSDQ